MNEFPDKLLSSYPDQQHIYKCSKASVFKLLDQLRLTVEDMNDFERFPEGASGALIYALIMQESNICPDRSDFDYVCQDLHVFVDAAFEDIGLITF